MAIEMSPPFRQRICRSHRERLVKCCYLTVGYTAEVNPEADSTVVDGDFFSKFDMANVAVANDRYLLRVGTQGGSRK